MQPVFSVVVPTYNRPAMLRRAVSSVLAQTFADFEVIVVDDASPGGPPLLEPGPADPRVRVIRNERNLGAGASRNAGIRAARGRYISFLDDDDEYLDSFLASTHRTLEGAAGDVGMSWCSVRSIQYASGGPTEARTRTYPTEYPSTAELVTAMMTIGTGFGVTVKSACLRELGGFDGDLRLVEDTDLFLKLLEAGYFPVIVPGVHVVRHQHHGDRLTSPAQHHTRLRELYFLLSRYSRLMDRWPPLRRHLTGYAEYLEGVLARQRNDTAEACA
ncbi:MAG TPA: glycosyltransferase family 2 protein [Longimicrobium sp.]|nr:glycosyltransferase family 2 protein [Longimicrobium sp.]